MTYYTDIKCSKCGYKDTFCTEDPKLAGQGIAEFNARCHGWKIIGEESLYPQCARNEYIDTVIKELDHLMYACMTNYAQDIVGILGETIGRVNRMRMKPI